MPAPKRTRDEVVELLCDVFRRHGYDGANLRSISEATGLGRASLYHYFPEGKEQMGREVFAWIGAQVQTEMLDTLRIDGTPLARLQSWIGGVDRFYDGGKKNCLLGTMVLAGGVDRYTREIRAAFGALVDALAETLADAGMPATSARRRATGAVATIQGALVVARGMGDTSLFRRVLQDLPAQLLPANELGHGARGAAADAGGSA